MTVSIVQPLPNLPKLPKRTNTLSGGLSFELFIAYFYSHTLTRPYQLLTVNSGSERAIFLDITTAGLASDSLFRDSFSADLLFKYTLIPPVLYRSRQVCKILTSDLHRREEVKML